MIRWRRQECHGTCRSNRPYAEIGSRSPAGESFHPESLQGVRAVQSNYRLLHPPYAATISLPPSSGLTSSHAIARESRSGDIRALSYMTPQVGSFLVQADYHSQSSHSWLPGTRVFASESAVVNLHDGRMCKATCKASSALRLLDVAREHMPTCADPSNCQDPGNTWPLRPREIIRHPCTLNRLHLSS